MSAPSPPFIFTCSGAWCVAYRDFDRLLACIVYALSRQAMQTNAYLRRAIGAIMLSSDACYSVHAPRHRIVLMMPSYRPRLGASKQALVLGHTFTWPK
eukprot:scaffold160854_cov36-Tisochrysis_lutea.AAC.2